MKKSYSSKFKSQVALEAIRGDKTIAQIAGEYNLSPNIVSQWKKKLMKEASDVFATKKEKHAEDQYPQDELLRKIGQLNVEVDFLRKKYSDYLWKKGKS